MFCNILSGWGDLLLIQIQSGHWVQAAQINEVSLNFNDFCPATQQSSCNNWQKDSYRANQMRAEANFISHKRLLLKKRAQGNQHLPAKRWCFMSIREDSKGKEETISSTGHLLAVTAKAVPDLFTIKLNFCS